MSTLHAIEQEMNNLAYIHRVMETYESVAATYMHRTKQSIVESRSFYEGLRSISDDVSSAYQQEQTEERPRHLFLRIAFWKKFAGRMRRQREAAVWLSANTGLYGDIIQKTFHAFIRHISSVKSDIIIVGKRGKLLFDERMPRVQYIYHDLPDNLISIEDLAVLIDVLSRYQRIRIFYGKFESFISQMPISTVVGETAQAPYEQAQKSADIQPITQYLFEPSLEEIAHFFETEIMASLLQQITEESRLAKLAARMFQLDTATEHIARTLGVIAFERQRLLHQLENKKQLEVVTSRIAIGV